jgi:tetratricopeptide (TPR) repeat protein
MHIRHLTILLLALIAFVSPALPVLAATDIESIEKVASLAIESSQRDLEVVKWVVSVVAGALSVFGIIAGLLGLSQLRDAKKQIEDFGDKQKTLMANARSAITQLMELEHFLDQNLQQMLGYRSAIEERRHANKVDPTADETAGNAIRQLSVSVIGDLDTAKATFRNLDTKRWTAWEQGARGLVFICLGEPDKAIVHLKAAIAQISSFEDSGRMRLASHYYNLACAYSLKAAGGNMSATDLDDCVKSGLDAVARTLEYAPWRWNMADKDDDFAALRTQNRFAELIAAAKRP